MTARIRPVPLPLVVAVTVVDLTGDAKAAPREVRREVFRLLHEPGRGRHLRLLVDDDIYATDHEVVHVLVSAIVGWGMRVTVEGPVGTADHWAANLRRRAADHIAATSETPWR